MRGGAGRQRASSGGRNASPPTSPITRRSNHLRLEPSPTPRRNSAKVSTAGEESADDDEPPRRNPKNQLRNKLSGPAAEDEEEKEHSDHVDREKSVKVDRTERPRKQSESKPRRSPRKSAGDGDDDDAVSGIPSKNHESSCLKSKSETKEGILVKRRLRPTNCRLSRESALRQSHSLQIARLAQQSSSQKRTSKAKIKDVTKEQKNIGGRRSPPSVCDNDDAGLDSEGDETPLRPPTEAGNTRRKLTAVSESQTKEEVSKDGSAEIDKVEPSTKNQTKQCTADDETKDAKIDSKESDTGHPPSECDIQASDKSLGKSAPIPDVSRDDLESKSIESDREQKQPGENAVEEIKLEVATEEVRLREDVAGGCGIRNIHEDETIENNAAVESKDGALKSQKMDVKEEIPQEKDCGYHKSELAVAAVGTEQETISTVVSCPVSETNVKHVSVLQDEQTAEINLKMEEDVSNKLEVLKTDALKISSDDKHDREVARIISPSSSRVSLDVDDVELGEGDLQIVEDEEEDVDDGVSGGTSKAIDRKANESSLTDVKEEKRCQGEPPPKVSLDESETDGIIRDRNMDGEDIGVEDSDGDNTAGTTCDKSVKEPATDKTAAWSDSVQPTNSAVVDGGGRDEVAGKVDGVECAASASSRTTSSAGSTTYKASTAARSKLVYRPGIEFVQGARLEARDYLDKWYAAKIVDVNWDKKELFIHFERWSSRFDEWVSMQSPRLRPITRTSARKEHKVKLQQEFKVGEKVMAKWGGDGKMYPAQITSINSNGTFQVLFYDGINKTVKAIHITKISKDDLSALMLKTKPPSSEKKPKTTSAAKEQTTTRDGSKDRKVSSNKRSTSSDNDSGKSHSPLAKSQKREESSDLSVAHLATSTPSTTKKKGSTPSSSSLSKGEKSQQQKGQPSSASTGSSAKRKKLLVGGIFRAKRPRSEDEEVPNGKGRGITAAAVASGGGGVGGSSKGTKSSSRMGGGHSSPRKSKSSLHRWMTSKTTSTIEKVPSSRKRSGEKKKKMTSPPPSPVISKPVERVSEDDDDDSAPLCMLQSAILSLNQEDDSAEKKMAAAGGVARKEFVIEEDHNHFKCHVEGCGKGFRKETLLSSHLKHYHKELVCAFKRYSSGSGGRKSGSEGLPETSPGAKVQSPAHHVQETNHASEKPKFSTKTDASSHWSKTDGEIAGRKESMGKSISSHERPKGGGDGSSGSKSKRSANHHHGSSSKRQNVEVDKSSTATLLPPPPPGKDDGGRIGENSVTSKPTSTQPKSKKAAKGREDGSGKGGSDSGGQHSHLRRKERSDSGGSSKSKSVRSDAAKKRRLTSGDKSSLPTTKASDGGIAKDDGPATQPSKKRQMRVELHDPSAISAVVDGEVWAGASADGSPKPSKRRRSGTSVAEGSPTKAPPTTSLIGLDEHPCSWDDWDWDEIREEVVNCICNYREEDGLMIQCENCMAWQHGACFKIEEEDKVPENYVCFACLSPKGQRDSYRYWYDQGWWKKGEMARLNFVPQSEDESQRFQPKPQSVLSAHTLATCVLDVQNILRSLHYKLHIVRTPNHPDLPLWSRPWCDGNQSVDGIKDTSGSNHQQLSNSVQIKPMDTPRAFETVAVTPSTQVGARRRQLSYLDHSYSAPNNTVAAVAVAASDMVAGDEDSSNDGLMISPDSLPSHSWLGSILDGVRSNIIPVAAETDRDVKGTRAANGPPLENGGGEASFLDHDGPRYSGNEFGGRGNLLQGLLSSSSHSNNRLTASEAASPKAGNDDAFGNEFGSNGKGQTDGDRLLSVVQDSKLTNNIGTSATASMEAPSQIAEDALVQCQLNLLDHIDQLQREVDRRLEEINAHVEALETELELQPTAESQSKKLLNTLYDDLAKVQRLASFK